VNSKQVAGSLAIAGAALLAFISQWEGTKTVAYPDVIGVATVCTGHTDKTVKVGDVWTKEQCDAQLVEDVEAHGKRLLDCITVDISQNEYNAYASWVFNVGTGAACASTLVRLLNAGQHAGACDQLLKWDRAGGRQVRGLTNRRKAERELCLTPEKIE